MSCLSFEYSVYTFVLSPVHEAPFNKAGNHRIQWADISNAVSPMRTNGTTATAAPRAMDTWCITGD
jgi:hypothetical protein